MSPFDRICFEIFYKVTQNLANMQVISLFFYFFLIFLAYFKKKLYLCSQIAN